MSNRTCAVTAMSGAIILLSGTLLHPAHADPNDPLAAFTEYAADPLWLLSHLVQLLGMSLIVATLVLLAKQMNSSWSTLGSAIAIASLAVAATLQAVDGVALKVMVDRWANATTEKEVFFQAAYVVRQIEVGLASMLSLLMGLSTLCYGIAIRLANSMPKWLGWLALCGGLAMTLTGVFMAHSGFSALPMLLNMSASSLLLIWLIMVAVWLWRQDSAID